MVGGNANINTLLNSPVRKIGARVELLTGFALEETFNYNDKLKEITIDKVGEESKFFGFGVCQKANIKLIDKERKINVTTDNNFIVYLGAEHESGYMDYAFYTFPQFYVTEVHRDENTNELSITAYDLLYEAASHTAAELNLVAPYTLLDVANACADLLEIPFGTLIEDTTPFLIPYENGANLEGTETIREVLDAIAEATQTIYFINGEDYLEFKRLDKDGDAVYTIDKAQYITLDSKTNRRLSTIVSATELGDNVSASLDATGSTQYVRDNPFWELREDIDILVTDALLAMGGFTINQFDCKWRGNFLLEIGDKINLVTKDNNTVTSYVLNDSITYNGSLTEHTQWNYTDAEGTESNSASLGEALKKTFARVDKANKEIALVVDETNSLRIDTNNIIATVSKTEEDVTNLKTEVSAKMSAEDVTIAIEKSMLNGADKVTTATGFTFDADGLRVSKSDSEISTQITEDGMQIYKNNKEVLTVDNQGIKAEDLHATTYLIIGNNSRFEDFGSNRTGCFWINV